MIRRGLLLFLLAAASVQAQLTESIEVRITNVDVVVTDRAGKPVKGLTKDDFEVFEEGAPQPITNFYEVRDDTAALAAGETAPAPPVAAPAPPEVSQRRIVVFVDNFSIHPFARSRAVESLERALDSLMRPGDEAMVMFWDRTMRVAVPFTSDREHLVGRLRGETRKAAAAMSMSARRTEIIEQAARKLQSARTGGRFKEDPRQAYADAIAAARAFAEELRASQIGLIGDLQRTITTLAGLEGKKALIFLGSELGDNPGIDLFHQIDGMFSSFVKTAQPPEFRESGRSISRELREIAAKANGNNVTMYMIDTADRDAIGDPTTYMPDYLAIAANYTNTPLAMATIASLTGGLSVPGGDSFDAALKTIASDLSSYYSLGYRSPEGTGSRRIVVKVKRDGLRVRSRASYIPKDGDEDVQDRVVANVFHPGVKSDFPVSVTTGTPQRDGRGRFKVQVTVTLPSSMTLIPQDDTLAGEFAVFIATGKENGALSDVAKVVQPLKFPSNARDALAAQKTFTYTATLQLREGEQVVSVGVTDTLAGTAGFARTKVVAESQ